MGSRRRDNHPHSEGGTDTAEPEKIESAPCPSFPPKIHGEFPAPLRGLRTDYGADG